MTAHKSLLLDLEDALQSDSLEHRSNMLHRISDLFVRTANSLGEDQITLFDQLLTRMVEVIEAKALVELSHQLAPIPNAPATVVRRLASHDQIQVAGPVLAESKTLTDADLVEIARTKGQAHLLAISDRHELDESVTDVLLDRGETQVVQKVASTPGARLSKEGVTILVARAENDADIAEAMLVRSDIPKYLYTELLTQATEAVRQKLLKSARPDVASRVQETIAKVSEDLASRTPKPSDYDGALQRIRAQHGAVSEQTVFAFASGRQVVDTVAALSLVCSLPIDLVDRLMYGRRLEPILILCKASNFGWATVRAILEMRGRDGKDAGYDITQACEDYKKHSEKTAKQILRFWKDRESSVGRPMNKVGPADRDAGFASAPRFG